MDSDGLQRRTAVAAPLAAAAARAGTPTFVSDVELVLFGTDLDPARRLSAARTFHDESLELLAKA